RPAVASGHTLLGRPGSLQSSPKPPSPVVSPSPSRPGSSSGSSWPPSTPLHPNATPTDSNADARQRRAEKRDRTMREKGPPRGKRAHDGLDFFLDRRKNASLNAARR